ncbi:hypothetical protein H072_3156 [Dactylellina haptotyla CBS 200.50]|uniref:RNase H type-1 domain-containing protein n=1 Tax=Dactylellina haptotyla (strain CBS 200.50) TaxID=1284197 RepID=S8BTK1_DACHA|nr:hypothetical protein H072_3156 [Dactylellina haptotyla CBS 200.50]
MDVSSPQVVKANEDIVAQLLSRDSSLAINTRICDPLNSEILGTNSAVGHLGDETRVVFQMLTTGPMSLLSWNFFIRYVNGKTLPWLNGQEIFFPEADKFKPACYIPMRDDKSDTHDYGFELIFRKNKGGTTRVRVFGIAELPLIIGGIPLRLSCLLVDALPLHRTEYEAEMPVLLILQSLLNGRTVPVRYHQGIVQNKPRLAANINTCILSDTGAIALEVYADVANPKCHKRGAVYDYGYGVWFGEDSAYNACGSMELNTSKPDYILELRGALQVLYAIRNMCNYNYSAFDFTDVVIYCSSQHIIEWINEWEGHWEINGWMDSLKLEPRAKNLWDEIMSNQKLARRNFHWKYLDRSHNEEASTLARTAVMGMNCYEYSILMNEQSNLYYLRGLVKPEQRPGKYFQGISLEGGMCRKNHPKGFNIATCCMCSTARKGWEKYFHF